jgi:hypothetical protein
MGPKIKVTRTTDAAVEVQPVVGDFRPFVWFPLKGLTNYNGKLGVMWWLEKRLTQNQKFILELLAQA